LKEDNDNNILPLCTPFLGMFTTECRGEMICPSSSSGQSEQPKIEIISLKSLAFNSSSTTSFCTYMLLRNIQHLWIGLSSLALVMWIFYSQVAFTHITPQSHQFFYKYLQPVCHGQATCFPGQLFMIKDLIRDTIQML